MGLATFIDASAQTTAQSVRSVLEERIQPSAVTTFQLQSYLTKRIPKLPPAVSPEKWQSEEARIRSHVLEDIAFHGWPREWIGAPPRFQETDVIDSGKGYRLRKFRYEIVPSFDSTAILYEPQNINGKSPAILPGSRPLSGTWE
jgi:hypothetical protein